VGGFKIAEGRNVFIGILAIILGLIVILFPIVSVATFSILVGIGIIFLGIWLLLQGFNIWGKNMVAGIADIILAIFAIGYGLIFLGNIKGLEFLTFLALYVVGIFIIITGLTALFSDKGVKGKSIGALGVVLGILFMVIGTYLKNILVLAAIIGAFLIIAGIMEIFELGGEVIPETLK
jgi:membrane protein HdeD